MFDLWKAGRRTRVAPAQHGSSSLPTETARSAQGQGRGETETETRTLRLDSREDLAYLEALIDGAPRLFGRADTPDSLTDYYRDLIKKLLLIAKEHALCEGADHG